MRYSFLILLFVGISASTTFAQDFYLKAGTGYAFAMQGQKLDQLGNALNGSVNYPSSAYSSYNLKTASFSSGVHGVIGGGYLFTKNIGVEVNADLNIVPRKYTEMTTGEVNNSGQYYDYTAMRQSKTTILFTPSFVMQTANATRCNLYMRMGIVLPVNTGIKMQETYHFYQTGDIQQFSWNITNYFSLGATAATGLKFRTTDDLALYGEASMLYLALSRRERDMESAVINGRGYPPSQLSGIITSYHYVKNGSGNTTGTEQAFSQPYSNFAVNIGVSYTLKKRSKNNTQPY